MITPTALLIPVAKGFITTIGGTLLLGGGGLVLHKRFLKPDPLIEFLSTVTEKKFSSSTLVSRTNKGGGTKEYVFKIPTGFSVEKVSEYKQAIEESLDCEILISAKNKCFVFEVCSHPIPEELEFNSSIIKEILKDYECGMYLGESRFGQMVIDFTDNATPHMLFGGPTGGGKSNLLNQGICGMMESYSSSEVNFYLIDLKDGVELNPYQYTEHVKGFYETFAQVEEGLSTILLELKRRNGLFKIHKVKKLSQFNQVSADPLPRIIIVADEFAQFSHIADRELKKSIMGKWEEILQKGRSAGVHVVIGTQVADADVFPKQIKGNIDARFGFKFTDIQHSRMIASSTDLLYLPNIQGRGMFKLGTKAIQTQVPLLHDYQMAEVIEKYRVEVLENEISLNEETMGDVENESREEQPMEENEVLYGLDDIEFNDIESLFEKEDKKEPATM